MLPDWRNDLGEWLREQDWPYVGIVVVIWVSVATLVLIFQGTMP